MLNIREITREAIIRAPAVGELLPLVVLQFAFSEIKTLEYFQTNINHLVKSVYDGYLGGDFVDILGSLITGQMTDAYRRAWIENDGQGDLPDYLQTSLDDFITTNINFDWIYQYYKDIVDARIDEKPIEPLLVRAKMWANQYNAAYNEAERLINVENGGNLVWKKGNTEHGCRTCADLDGIVMFASQWEMLELHPQGYPNPLLECGGGGPGNFCDCKLEPTDKRRSPKALDTVLNIIERNKKHL